MQPLISRPAACLVRGMQTSSLPGRAGSGHTHSPLPQNQNSSVRKTRRSQPVACGCSRGRAFVGMSRLLACLGFLKSPVKPISNKSKETAMPDTNDPQQDESRLIDRMMTDLLSAMDQDNSDMRSTLIQNGDDIRALAETCRQTGVFEHSHAKFAEFKQHLEDSTPPEERLVKSWTWLLDRIVHSPTTLHMRGAVRLCVPLVALYLPPE